MAARCSFLSTPALPSVPSGIAQGPQQIDLRPTPIIHAVEPEDLLDPFSLDEDIIAMDFLPDLLVPEHLIGSTPTGAGNYVASPPPFLEDPTTNALPPPSSLLMPPMSSRSLFSQYDHIPRACHGVERRQRSRPLSRGGADYLHFSKLTRHERAAHKNAASRRVAFAESMHMFASTSLWISTDDAPPLTTATDTGKLKRRPPTPRYATSFDVACSPLDDDERDASPGSPGFDADVEFEPAEVEQRSREQGDDKERLTIIVPGGKSEAYVAMAFERSCSLSTEDEDDYPSGDVHQSHDSSDTNEKTGLKIKIPVPNPLFMLSLRLASSCRVSDEEEQAEMKEGYTGTGAGAAATAHNGDDDDDDDEGPKSQSGMTQDQEQDHRNHLNPGTGGSFFASSRSPTPPVAPPSSPAPPEGRPERRVARRAALAPYCTIDRLHAARARGRPCLSY